MKSSQVLKDNFNLKKTLRLDKISVFCSVMYGADSSSRTNKRKNSLT